MHRAIVVVIRRLHAQCEHATFLRVRGIEHVGLLPNLIAHRPAAFEEDACAWGGGAQDLLPGQAHLPHATKGGVGEEGMPRGQGR